MCDSQLSTLHWGRESGGFSIGACRNCVWRVRSRRQWTITVNTLGPTGWTRSPEQLHLNLATHARFQANHRPAPASFFSSCNPNGLSHSSRHVHVWVPHFSTTSWGLTLESHNYIQEDQGSLSSVWKPKLYYSTTCPACVKIPEVHADTTAVNWALCEAVGYQMDCPITSELWRGSSATGLLLRPSDSSPRCSLPSACLSSMEGVIGK